MARGDHIFVTAPDGYRHHGIDCGLGDVIHYTGRAIGSSSQWSSGKGTQDMAVRRTSFDEFAGGRPVKAVEHENSLPCDEVVKRAESKVGERAYKLLFNNCEHFANWCKTNRKRSQQVEATATIGTALIAFAIWAGARFRAGA